MRGSRRKFLAAAASLPLSVAARGAATDPLAVSSPAQIDAIHREHSSFDPWVEVHAANLRANTAAVHQRVKRPILAVIKNNGYGAGVANVARVLEPLESIAGFAVVKLHEAHALRDAGIRKPILLMGPLDATELADAVRRDITLMVYTPIAAALDRAATAVRKRVDVHVCVDTASGASASLIVTPSNSSGRLRGRKVFVSPG